MSTLGCLHSVCGFSCIAHVEPSTATGGEATYDTLMSDHCSLIRLGVRVRVRVRVRVKVRVGVRVRVRVGVRVEVRVGSVAWIRTK